MTKLSYYYDFISPFSYLLHEQLHRLPDDIELIYTPVLFAGLLKHWGTLGPVEIDRKKLLTYRHTSWLADRMGIPFRVPDTHPFNPLPYLRLSIALNNDPELVTALFRAIWRTDNNPATNEGRMAIWDAVGFPHADTLTNDPEVKQALITNTRAATEQGVFGVPTITVGKELFWGLDSFDMLIDYLARPNLFENETMTRLNHI